MVNKVTTARLLRRMPWVMRLANSVYHYTRPRFTGGVVGVVINEAGEILLAEHVYHPAHPWGLPGGWVDRHEPPEQAVAREFREELSLTIEVGPVIALARTTPTHWNCAYLCQPIGTVGALCSELLDYRWCAPEQLPPLSSFHDYAVRCALHLLAGRTGAPPAFEHSTGTL